MIMNIPGLLSSICLDSMDGFTCITSTPLLFTRGGFCWTIRLLALTPDFPLGLVTTDGAAAASVLVTAVGRALSTMEDPIDTSAAVTGGQLVGVGGNEIGLSGFLVTSLLCVKSIPVKCESRQRPQTRDPTGRMLPRIVWYCRDILARR